MLALAPAPCKACLPARRSVVVKASAQGATPDFVCPLVKEASVCAKTSCVHPGRPVAQACRDCPRVGFAATKMAKSKCVHPQRPLSQACADCPRRK